jgi:hypothetical protein
VSGGLVIGWLLATLRTTAGVASQTLNSTTNETFSQRLSVWTAALHAIGHRPLLGAGPGQFRAATSAIFSVAFERANGGLAFSDAHNIVLQVAVTTGVFGLVLAGCWLGLAAATRRGPLLWVAGAMFAVQLAEPLNVSVTSVMVLSLGAAAVASDAQRTAGPGGEHVSPRPVRAAAVFLAVVTIVPAVAFIVGDGALNRSITEHTVAQDTSALSDARAANDLLRPWPEPASQLNTIYTFQSVGTRSPAPKRTAIHWAEVAASRDPSDWVLWTNLADVQALAGRLDDATTSARQALTYFPAYVPALLLLGDVASNGGHPAMAHYWYGRALSADPSNTALRALSEGRCPPGSRTRLRNPLLPRCHL